MQHAYYKNADALFDITLMLTQRNYFRLYFVIQPGGLDGYGGYLGILVFGYVNLEKDNYSQKGKWQVS